jgi:hypothetical protein
MKTNKKKKAIDNSFLIETSFNSDIDLVVRKEIEDKYKKSKTNSEYVFPRFFNHTKSKSKQLSEKNSFENLGKPQTAHKTIRSSINHLILPVRTNDKIFSKDLKFPLKMSTTSKNKDKKSLAKYRGISYKQIKTERNYKSKSPKNSKKIIQIYLKKPGAKKPLNTDTLNKIFTPYNSNPKILENMSTVRLKKILYSVEINS